MTSTVERIITERQTAYKQSKQTQPKRRGRKPIEKTDEERKTEMLKRVTEWRRGRKDGDPIYKIKALLRGCDWYDAACPLSDTINEIESIIKNIRESCEDIDGYELTRPKI